MATLRSLLSFAVADGRLTVNVAAAVAAPSSGQARREGQVLDPAELLALAYARLGRYADVVLMLGLQGLRWAELAGLRVGDRVSVPGPGLRLLRAVLARNGGSTDYVDTLKNKRPRTVPLLPEAAEIVERWSLGKGAEDWLFGPGGRAIARNQLEALGGLDWAKATIDRPTLRLHDLRHTAASLWLSAGADPKVVQRVLGHASAAMTMDLYGHLIDRNRGTPRLGSGAR